MRDLGNKKWLAISCGAVGLATILSLGIKVPIHGAARMTLLSQLSSPNHATASAKTTASLATTANLIKKYGQLPLSFEPSASTSNSPAKFLARGSGYTLFVANDEAVLELRGKSKAPAVVRMELAGANATPQFSALEELPGKSNYFIGNDPKKWRTNVPQYRKIMERNVYSGVDLVYYGTQGRLEYDFDVAPGTDPHVIQLAFKDAGSINIDANGELIVNTDGGEVRMRKPVAYQEIAGVRQPVAVGYALKDKSSATFEIAQYDAHLPLVIDPILAYSTYLGGSDIDGSNGIAVAPDNTAFIAGSTFSTDFPTVHPLQANRGGAPDFPSDAFVAKISADGSTLLYSTYLGASLTDTANGIAVDNFGNAYVVGTTDSFDFPVTFGSVNVECGGDGKCGASWNTGGLIVSNAFLTKLNAAGSAIIYSTFFGEYEHVRGQAIAVDANGVAYIAGQTMANFAVTSATTAMPPPFPITGNAFQPAFGGGTWNGFVAKIAATGDTILYSSYLGGNTEDSVFGIAVDGNATMYATGLAYSTTFPTTAGALQTANAGAGDAFVSKINTNLSGSASLVYSTFLGGTGLDQGNAIALDSTGAAYVGGVTNSPAFGFAPSGFQTTYGGQGDAFVAKLSAAGALNYFTYLGGSKADSATGVAVDSTNNVYVTGSTVSTDFPTAGAVFQPAYGGGNADSFVAKLNSAGGMLVYSSFLGGTNTELASGIAVDTGGSAYVTGQTCSEDFPLSNPLQVVPGGNCDAYVAKVSVLAGFAFNPGGLVFPAQSINTTSQTQIVTLTNGENPQTIGSIALSGANPGDFHETTTCGSSMAVGATCTISVSFTPTTGGIRKASVVVTDSAPGSPHVVNLSGNTSTVTLSTSSLSFGQVQVGVASTSLPVVVTNSGTTPLTFTSITASGDFVEGNNCTTAPIQPGTNCLINVFFTPSAAFASVGAVTLTDSGSGSPQIILATGTGILVPGVAIAPASLTFQGQTVGTVSSPQVVGLANSGTAPLTITGIATSGDFAQTNNCGLSVAPGAACAISVTFSPTIGGTRSGTLTITDNGSSSPQRVALTGTGAAFQITTSAPSATVPAGKPATYTLTIASIGGFGQPVALTCSGAPADASCSVSPTTVTPAAGAPQTATVTVVTGSRTFVPPATKIKTDPFSGWRNFGGAWLLLIAAVLMVLTMATVRRRPFTAAFGFAVVLLLVAAGCSGGGSVGTPSGTPAGTYQITVTGSSGAVTNSMPLSLQVN